MDFKWNSPISATWSRSKLKTKNTKPMGGHSHKQWYAPTATHLTLYFHPTTSAQNPCFCQKLSPKVLFLSHCPEFWKFFTHRPRIGWNLKGTQIPSCFFFFFFFLWLLSLKDPLFFCLAYTCLFEGNVAPSNTVRSWKILYSRNRIERFGEYFQVQI